MLVLTRGVNERIVVPGIGTITIVDQRGKKVRLGFEFDPDIKVYREEVWDSISGGEAAGRGHDESTKEKATQIASAD